MRLMTLVVVLVLAGCAKTPPEKAPAQSARSIEDRDWDLVALGEQENPLGAGGKPATLRFDAAAKRAAGNAGCNRYSAAYVMAGDSLRFEAAISTRMACPDGMELENAWLGAMSHVATWSATDSTLTLVGADGPLARFAERGPGANAP
jgi:heat shock protein HslJ